MKLVIAIVNKDDSALVMQKLTKEGFMSTKLSTTGGFLRAGNTTLLIGTEEERVDDVLEILRVCCSRRTETVNASATGLAEPFFSAVPVEVTVGGATGFVVDVDKFIKM